MPRKPKPSPPAAALEPVVDPFIARIEEMEAHFARGRESYCAAGEIMDALSKEMQVGQIVTMPDGSTRELIDAFAEKNTVYKPAGVSRFQIKTHKAKGRK